MPDLMHRRLALAVPVHVPVGHTSRQDITAVGAVVRFRKLDHLAGATGAVGDVGGEGAVAQQLRVGGGGGGRGREVGLEIDVQGGVVALTKGRFHGGVGGVCGPGVIDRVRDVAEGERDGRTGVGGFEGVELASDHGGSDKGLGVGGGDDVEVGVDGVFGDCTACTQAGGGDGFGEVYMRGNEMRAWWASTARTREDLSIVAFMESFNVLDLRNDPRGMGKVREREKRIGDCSANEECEKE